MAQQVEAEINDARVNATNSTEIPDYTGTSAVKIYSDNGYIEFNGFAPSEGAGTYIVLPRMGDPYGSTTRVLALTVNTVSIGNHTAVCTADVWTTGSTLSITLLASGNVIRFTAPVGNTMIDNFILTKLITTPDTNAILYGFNY